MEQLQRCTYNHNNTHCLQSFRLPLQGQHPLRGQSIPASEMDPFGVEGVKAARIPAMPGLEQRLLRGQSERLFSDALGQAAGPWAEHRPGLKTSLSCWCWHLPAGVPQPQQRARDSALHPAYTWTSELPKRHLLENWRLCCVGGEEGHSQETCPGKAPR